jgi:ubiquinone biosynthesis protein UbiJ
MLAEILFRPFEALLQRGLEQSTSAQRLAAELEGRVLALTIESTPFDLRLKVTGGRIAVALPDGAAPDASISGTPLGLARLLREDPQAVIRAGAVRFGGDTELAARFRSLLGFAAPDLEEELAKFVGDPLARQAGNAARGFAAWADAAGDSLARSTSEYVQHEARVTPTPGELADFARRVDELGNDVARAAARLQALRERLRS